MRIFIVILFLLPNLIIAQPSEDAINRVMAKINMLRSTGCKCGNERMKPVPPVVWDKELYKISNEYARYMYRHDHFDHIAKDGSDLGDRLDRHGYSWDKLGENLAYGYRDFNKVLRAWIKSPSHCRMLLDPDVTNMGLSKRGSYWVQSFALPSESIFANSRSISYDKL